MKKNITEAGKVDIESLKKALSGLESHKVQRDRERAELFTGLYEGICDKPARALAANDKLLGVSAVADTTKET